MYSIWHSYFSPLFRYLSLCVCVCFFKLVFVCARFFYVYFYLLQAIYYPNNYRAEYLLLSMRDTIFIP